ncbi:MAG: hypothetical protein WC254_03135 [Candidatus Woesearchaeota archaeon]|jgi:hypothetical protein
MKMQLHIFTICLFILIITVNSCSEENEQPSEGIALCGNNICDAHENERGSCPEDCETSNDPNLTEEDPTAERTYVYDGKTPVYVTIYTHNEESWNTNVGTKERYIEYRTDLLERLQIIHEYGAKLNWQSDWGVLLAMSEYETEDLWDTTNDKHILEYMTEDLGFSADPHTHLTQYNYADIAHLFELNDMTPTGVIGGVAALECEGNEIVYNNWQNVIDLHDDGYIYGDVYSEAQWKPTILAVPAMGGHYWDDFSSGVWIPGEEFSENDPTGTIVYVGQGYPHNQNGLGTTHASGAPIVVKDGEYIKELVEKYRMEKYLQEKYILHLSTSKIRQIMMMAENKLMLTKAYKRY